MRWSGQDRWAGVIILLFLLALSIPFFVAQTASNDQSVFAGFLFNPTDSHTYLAKMRQGFDGNWLFTLPYTAEAGQGAALYPFYLALGHLARGLGWSLVFTFHAARLAGALLLALALYRLIRTVLPPSPWRLFALFLGLFGSGLGWLVITSGWLTTDFWVAETYPFLSGLANPHFALGLAMQIWLITPLAGRPTTTRLAAVALVAAFLSVVDPFGWPVVLAVLAAAALLDALRKTPWRDTALLFAAVLFGGLPYAAYDFWILNTNPAFAAFSRQNVTLTPSPVDLLIALSPALLAAILGAYRVWFGQDQGPISRVLVWLVVGALIIWIPSDLQRRLLSGYFVPVAVMAAYAFQAAPRPSARRRLPASAVAILSLPTILVIVLGSLSVARQHDPAFSLYTQELQAFTWLDQQAPPRSLVLASPATGLRLPAYTSSRVLYGHPIETIDADQRRSEVEQFFAGRMNEAQITDYLQTWQVDYIFYGPRERELGPLPLLPGWHSVFQAGQTQLWAPESPSD